MIQKDLLLEHALFRQRSKISESANKQMTNKILGIDYGRAKVGLALGVGTLAEPLKVIRYKDTELLRVELIKIIQENNIDKVVVGLSEGDMAEETKKFVLAIQPFIHSTIELFDETLTSRDAQKLSIEAGVNRKKRHQMEDAYAASLMLQSYLDSI